MNRNVLSFHSATALALSLGVGLFAAGSASAQSAPAADDVSAPEESGGIADIVVTARRREEAAQSVPASIQAFATEALVQNNVRQISDLATMVPGFSVVGSSLGPSAVMPTIRGLRNGLNQLTYDSPVAVYINDVVQTRPQGLADGLYDIASVQVLKGPQGTLFGRNSSGGAMLITTQKPTDEVEGYVMGSYGNYDYKYGEAAVNLPISDALQVRFAGAIKRRDGWINNPTASRKVGNARSESWRVSVRIAPTDSIENLLVYNGGHINQDGAIPKLTGVRDLPAFTAAKAQLADYATKPFRYTTAPLVPHGDRVNTHMVSNTTSIELGDVTLKNIFGYNTLNTTLYFGISGSSAFVLDSLDFTRVKTVTNELQAFGQAFDGQLDWIIGGYYLRESGSELQRTRLFASSTIVDVSQVTESYAGFGQISYRPAWADKLSITAGLRFTKDRKDFTTRSRLASGPGSVVAQKTPDFFGGTCRVVNANIGGTPLSPCLAERSVSYSEPTYSLSADYKLGRGLLVYAAHRHGYQAGGFSHSATTPAALEPYKPQKVDDFELGFKSDYSLGTVDARTNVAVYLAKYSQIHRLLLAPIRDTAGNQIGATSAVVNAGRSKVKGIEVEQRFRFGDLLDLGFTYAYTDAYYTSFVDILGNDYTKSKFGGVPKHMATGSARVALPLPESFADAHFQVDGSYQSKAAVVDLAFYPATQTDSPFAFQKGYFLLNLRADFENVAGSATRVSFFGRNVLNEHYFNGGWDSSTSAAVGTAGRFLGNPRTYGVEVAYKF